VTALTAEQREELAETLASNTVPWLTYAVHMGDADTIANLLIGLDPQELMALAVVLASRCPRPLMRPDDGVVDEIAVARACAGERVPLSGPERVAAARALIAQGIGATKAAERLHVSGTTATRLYARITAEREAVAS
jgi:hypothetical protein